MAPHFQNENRSGQDRRNQGVPPQQRSLLGLAILGRFGLGLVRDGTRRVSGVGCSLCNLRRLLSERLYNGFFAGVIHIDRNDTSGGRQCPLNPSDAGCTGHVFHCEPVRLRFSRVPCNPESFDGIIYRRWIIDLDRCGFRSQIDAHLLHTRKGRQSFFHPTYTGCAAHIFHTEREGSCSSHTDAS